MGWAPRKAKWRWKDYLTEDEASEVRDYERRIVSARHEIAQVQPAYSLIRNRAIHRAKYEAAKGRLHQPGAHDGTE